MPEKKAQAANPEGEVQKRDPEVEQQADGEEVDGVPSPDRNQPPPDPNQVQPGEASSTSPPPVPQAQPEGVASTTGAQPVRPTTTATVASTTSSAPVLQADPDGASSTTSSSASKAVPQPPNRQGNDQNDQDDDQDDDQGNGQNLSDEQIVERLFNLNQPAPQGQGGGQQPPHGVHAPSYLPAAQPKKTTKWDVFDIINKGSGYFTDLGGMVSGTEKMAFSSGSPNPRAIGISKVNSKHSLYSGIFNTTMSGIKSASSIYSTARHSQRAKKLKGKDRIEYKKSTLNAVSSGLKSVGGLLSTSGGGASLGGAKGAASGLGIAGSAFGSLGSLIDVAASGEAAEKYRKIAKNYGAQGIQNRQRGANRITDNSVLDAAEMVSLTARNKHKKNAASSVSSAFGLLGSLTGLGGGISGAAGSKYLGGLFGLIGSSIGLIGKAVGDSVGYGLNKTSAASRRQYVTNYLNSEALRIQGEALQGDQPKHIPGVGISLDDAKRIALKKLGMFSDNTVQPHTPLNLDDKQLDMIYNSLAMKRAQSIHDSVHSANGSDDGDDMLDDLGLSRNATVEEIAAMLGYEK